MAARNRKKKQGCDEAELLGCKKEDPWALVRKLEAQLAQEKFFHEKTKTDHQYEVKTLQAKVKNLEKQRKIFLEKLEQNPIEQQNKLEKELNDTSRQLREITQKLVSSQQQVDKLLRSNRAIKKSKEKLSEEFLERIKNKNALIQKLEAQILDLKTSQENRIRIHKDSGPERTNACLEVEDERQETDHQYNMVTTADFFVSDNKDEADVEGRGASGTLEARRKK
ncbi:uncharacterized protein [Porites lutea]|uniref:uncharacterized protein n=1 Tax=Porites lutea TaxID=51062 RepID=UPI003CC69448